MSRQAYVAAILAELARRIGLGDLVLDASGRAALMLDGRMLYLAHATEPAMELLWLTTDLGEIPAGDAEALRGCLELGFLAWIGNGMTLALGEDGRRVYGYSAIPVVNLDVATLERALTQLADTAKLLAERIARRDFDTGVDTDPGSAADTSAMRV